MSDQPTGPELADRIAGLMPGWKRDNGGEGHWVDSGGMDHWTGRSPYPHARMFRPQENVADAMEAAEALNILLITTYDSVIASFYEAPMFIRYRTITKREGRTLAQAICDAVCGVAVQLPKGESDV